MANPTEEHTKPRGILVLEEFPIPLSPYQFVKFLIPPEKYPYYLPAQWLRSDTTYVETGLLYATCKYSDNRQIGLYCFPEALGLPSRLEDVKSAIETIGFVVIVDIESILGINREIVEKYSAIRWAKPYKLPIIISVIHANRIDKSVEKLSRLIDYSSDMPIIWCDGDIDLDFVQRTMDVIYSDI